VGFGIGVVRDSVEAALHASGDVFFTATAEYYDRKQKEDAASPASNSEL
jgi:serine/threonine transporter